MDDELTRIVNSYTSFQVNNIEIKLPYFINTKGIKTFGRYKGKGNAKQLKLEVERFIEFQNINLAKIAPSVLTKLLKENGVGIDCSGYAYNILNEYLLSTRNLALDKFILKYNGFIGSLEKTIFSRNRIQKINASKLTDIINVIKINKVKDMRPGDLIRLTHPNWNGKHVAVVIQINDKSIIYTHSSDSQNITTDEGPHIARINITNPNQGLEKQNWEEETNNRKNYGDFCFKVENNDYVSRLKCLS